MSKEFWFYLLNGIWILSACLWIALTDTQINNLEKRITILETKLGIDQCHKN